MSAPAALKAVSHRDSLAKTVRLLTRDGIDVQFRGHQPHVATKGNKAIRLVLPELNDSASPELLDAIQGYLDHEVGHIFYTPFARATKAGNVDPKAPALINIVEDIRLEKLLPRGNDKVRAMPGTKENLERMYEKFIPNMIHPATSQMVATGNPSKMFAGVMVPALRALAGQKAFQEYMDANSYWPHFMPLLQKMPDLARRLKAMETFDDVEAIVTDILEALKPPKPEPKEKPGAKAPPQKPQESDCSGDGDNDSQDDDDASDGADSGPDGDDSDDAGDSSSGDDSDDDAEGDAGDQPDDGDEGDDEVNAGGGEGHGDGSGTNDEEGDDDDGSCSGDGDEDGDDTADDKGDGSTDRGGDEDGEGDSEPTGEKDESDKPVRGGKDNVSITDALKQLDPTERKALFMYKQRKQSVADIATAMQKSEDEVLDLLRNARRRLGEIMKGARK